MPGPEPTGWDTAKAGWFTSGSTGEQGAWAAYGCEALDWGFAVVADETPNASALPGGKIIVNDGILKVADTDDLLASVVGREMAHALARHTAEQLKTVR